MKKIIPLLSLAALLLFAFCKNETSTQNNAEAQKTAVEEKEAMKLDSISTELDKEKAEIEEGVQKLEESLKALDQ
jgi:hypothetical protein